ncbi:hypothetical protein [Leptolyngbya phage Lbo-JY46]
MGQHTWFYKEKDKYLKMNELFEKADKAENYEDGYDELDAQSFYRQAEKLSEENESDYHNCFRTSKRNKDGTYTNDVIYSKKECDEWLESNKEFVYSLDRESLDRFWDEYPNGVIEFG